MIIVVFQSNEEIIYYSRNDTESIRYSCCKNIQFPTLFNTKKYIPSD